MFNWFLANFKFGSLENAKNLWEAKHAYKLPNRKNEGKE